MIRFMFRFTGLLLLALAFIFVIYDGMKSIVDRDLYLTRFGQFWIDLHSSSQDGFRAFVDTQAANLWPNLWPMLVQPVLDQPASAVFAVFSVVMILLGRKKRPLIGYARD
jgi:hypothetical protein